MEHSPSWEDNRLSDSQEITPILKNPKVHCRIYKCPPSVPILNQIADVCVGVHNFSKSLRVAPKL